MHLVMTLSRLFHVIAAMSRALLRHGSWWRDVADWFRLVTSIQQSENSKSICFHQKNQGRYNTWHHVTTILKVFSEITDFHGLQFSEFFFFVYCLLVRVASGFSWSISKIFPQEPRGLLVRVPRLSMSVQSRIVDNVIVPLQMSKNSTQ
jgi:hypothetical protein